MLPKIGPQGTSVCSLDVEYIGWKSYGADVQVVSVGRKFTCSKPLARPAVIDPDRCVVRSSSVIRRPPRVSRMCTAITSPGFMNRSRARWGVNVAAVCWSGPGGAGALPSRVLKAKLTGSTPTLGLLRQAALLRTLWFMSIERLSTLSAAHHCTGSQLLPPCDQLANPGG